MQSIIIFIGKEDFCVKEKDQKRTISAVGSLKGPSPEFRTFLQAVTVALDVGAVAAISYYTIKISLQYNKVQNCAEFVEVR